ncbi:flagellar biosynthesis protein FlhA [Pseudoduganella ginsengisoli]|uniref:Flagellar type III secretion system protein FlhA n=1 Tax=Pseudoduganella ginsengisoli TaxID=1462440 RepID=A0A6L6Q8L0_9BURK|nr:flagellar biosynthesis protein FlhA [Pseudoduganella ginsengisoli]MTW05955.1 flagellar type III secretion system protein FlhA [Pseudoduganella ginsengisoli]
MNALRRVLGANTDIAMVALVLGVLFMLFAPIPPELLDFFILANFSFALLILLLTFYMGKPVEFSTFPSLLLVATLFRLALNVSATRLILRDGDAGHVIGAIGSYVVGGNFVIGLIVFLILVVVQYVVVTNGAQRVSEVAARFTLDSMPGQQMSIDADLNMGFIDQDEAQRRRKNLSKEAAFYGAMDGASKFVKGDAIAGIIIMLINSVGGLVIGMMQHGLPWDQALQTYTLLTIGDGIVTQVPALVISVGTGLIVTRSSADDSLGDEAFRQITSFGKPLLLVAFALAGLTLLPGMPVWPALALVSVYLAAALLRRNAQRSGADAGADADAGAAGNGATGPAVAGKEDDPYALLPLEAVEVQLGVNLVAMLDTEQAVFMERIATFRKQYAAESGLVLPSVRFRPGSRLAADAYEIHVFGVSAAKGELMRGRLLAIHPGGDAPKLAGVETREPTFGLPALWIAEELRDEAAAGRYTLVDAPTAFMTHLCEVLRQHASTLLTRQETERLLKRVREGQPGLVEEIVPTVLGVGDVQRVLQNLLKEKVSIRNLDAVMETLVDQARHSKDTAWLTEMVRQRLGPLICQAMSGGAGTLQVMTLDPAIEHTLMENIRAVESGGALAVEPKFAEQVVSRVAHHAEKMMKAGLTPVLLCAPELRRHVRVLSERMAPQLRVLSMAEVPGTLELRAYATVTLQQTKEPALA